MMSTEKEGKPLLLNKEAKSLILSFEEAEGVEEKISLGLESMKKVLSKSENGSLTDFWALKNLVGPLFKEKMDPAQKNHFWSEYIELTQLARRLKEIREEQAAFSVDQFTLAIEGIEKDLSSFEALMEQAPVLHFSNRLKALSLDEKRYGSIEKKLWVLKLLIARLDSLRREVIALDMRMSHKNKLLKRLSQLGDVLFPKRKELIEEVSRSFSSDVNTFLEKRALKGREGALSSHFYYKFREEIKGFQSLAKTLTLNPQSFAKTHQLFSQSWDAALEKEKTLRQEEEKRFENGKQSCEDFLAKIEAFKTFCSQKKGGERAQILEQSKRLHQEIKSLCLSYMQANNLKDQVQKIEETALKEAEKHVQKVEEAIRIEIDQLQQRVKTVLENQTAISLEAIEKEELEVQAAYQKLILSEGQAHLFERKFAHLKTAVLNKREETSPLEHLNTLYQERIVHIEGIESQLRVYKEEMNRSNLDFERAMLYRELYESGKMHLDCELEALENLEKKLI